MATDDSSPPAAPPDVLRAAREHAAATEAALDDRARGDLARIRSASAALATPMLEPGDVHAAVAFVEQHADISPVAPVDSRNRVTSGVKAIVRKSVFFAVHHLAAQTSALGWSTVWLGQATAERIDDLERRIAQLERAVGPNGTEPADGEP
jgi:hypothetical protein